MATILVVDDRPSNRQFLTTLLGYGGHRMVEAGDGERALELVRADRPDLVITDILMPKMDGYEFVQHMRADADLAGMPVIFYTASYSAPEAATLARKCGVQKVLAKPSEPQDIVAAVNEVLGARMKTPKAPRSKAAEAPLDTTLSLYFKDLEAVQKGFRDLAARNGEPTAGRNAIKDLSGKFAENVARMQRVTARLSALVEVGMEMISERDPERLVKLFFSATCDLIESRYAAIGMLDQDEKTLRHVHAKGFDADFLRGEAGRKGLLGTLLDGQPVRTKRLAKNSLDSLEGHPRARDFLGIPVASADCVYGWLYFADSPENTEFTEDDERVATVMARRLAVLYENALLYDEIQRHAAQLQVEVSERRRAEQALRESEAGLRQAQAIARLAHVVVRTDGSYESTSPSMAELLGLPPGKALRGLEDYLHYVHPEDLERVRETIRHAVRSRDAYAIEYRIIRTDARVVHIRQDAVWLPNADGSEPTRRFATIQDVTERRAAEEKQREAAQLLDNIIENIPTAVQLKSVEDDFRVVMWNKASEAMYGVPRQEAIGRNVHDLWSQEDAERFHAADLDLIASGQMHDFPNRPAQTRARGEIRVHMRKVALFDPAGKATHLLVIADDITSQLADQARVRESEERFRSLSMLSSDWFWEQDAEHRFVEFSGGEGVKGWGPDQRKAIGLHRWDLGGVIPISCSWEEHKGLLDAHKPFRNFEYRRVLGDGRLQYVEASGEPIFDGAGSFTGYRGVATEITQRKDAENRIRRLNRVYAVLSGINTLIVRVRDRDELSREACRIAVEQGGFRMAWIGMLDKAAGLVRPVASAGDVGDFFAAAPLAVTENKPGGHGLAGRAVRELKPIVSNDIQSDPQRLMKTELEARGINSVALLPLVVGGEPVGVLSLYAAEAGFFDEEELKLLVELAGDISFALDHLQKTDKINYLAYYDELTGLANRTLFLERLGQMMRDAAGRNRLLALSILDIERFKAVNDAFGRPSGDMLLQEIAARMKAAGKEPTRMARLGADQFAVISKLAEKEDEIARLTENRLQEIFEAPFKIGGQELRVSARMGIAMFPQDGNDGETLLRSAETAVKNAKAAGERYVFFTQEMTARVADKLSLENKLRRAIEQEQFVLYYQPKVSLETRSVVGVEALIRWQTDKGLVPPLQFIPLLEETGLILQVGAWALKRAALDHRGWIERKLKAPRVAVNVSAVQLRQRDFVAMVEQAIMDGVAPTAIDLEITESLVMEDIKATIEKLTAVRGLGVEIAIDDFGTGYSSLSYLAQLPVQHLKIDRSFIIRMHEDPNAMTLVSTMISLAHSLRLKVIAEGVETEDQARFLRLLRCDHMQGYLFSKPVPAEDLVKLLQKER